jgi:cell division protein FtsI/penicillin-binding protein 2
MNTRRLLCVVCCLLLVEAFLFGRVVWLQTAKRREYKHRVHDQATCKITLRPRRGRIYDRNYELLAVSIKTHSLYTITRQLEDPDLTARTLAKNGIGSYTENKEKFSKHSDFVWVKRHITTENKIRIKGVYRCEDVKRVYPLGIASSLIGVTDPYGKGLSGVEYKFDKILEGKPRTVTMGKTPSGRLYPYPSYGIKEPKQGYDIILTIDAVIQAIIEEELENAVERLNAKDGVAIVLNPKTGEILGMASVRGHGNVAVEDQYEPGSTFKIVTLACVLEDSLASFDTIVEDGSGKCIVENKIIRDEKPHGPLTLREAVARSSNVGFINLAHMVGKEKLYKNVMLFGFGQKTGVELPGEASGNIYPPSEWTPLRFANIAFGQGISCTFLQLSMAFGCIANDGLLLKPHIVKEIVGNDRNVVYASKTKVVRRVTDESTARDIVELLMGVIRNGTGTLAKLEGLKIAGKTGTSQKYKNGRYTEDYTSSFIGFFPADDPSFLVGVLIDEPKGVHFGSLVAAPLFREIATRIISSEPIVRN